MVKSCCVKSCRAEWSPICALSFFSVPMKNEDLFNKWREILFKCNLGKHSAICSKHFLPNDIQRVGAKTMLKKNAVPTIFLDKQPKPLSIDIFHIASDHTYSVLDFAKDVHDGDTLTEFARNIAEIVKSNVLDQPQKSISTSKDVSVQTSPRKVGPSAREVQLQQKIKILQNKLRRRDKKITSIQEVLNHLKHDCKRIENF